tara:strand:+ start:1545 stop:2021 length:477 start_codon:yes stop_codon:yes gene_type:complete
MLERFLQQMDAWGQAFLGKPFAFVICLALLVFLIGYAYFKSQNRPIQVSRNGIGRIHVSRSALKELIRAACYAEATTKPRAHIVISRGKLQVSVRVHSNDDTSIHNLATRLQTRLAQSLYENIGEGEVGHIDIIVSGFKARKSPIKEEKEKDVPSNEG